MSQFLKCCVPWLRQKSFDVIWLDKGAEGKELWRSLPKMRGEKKIASHRLFWLTPAFFSKSQTTNVPWPLVIEKKKWSSSSGVYTNTTKFSKKKKEKRNHTALRTAAVARPAPRLTPFCMFFLHFFSSFSSVSSPPTMGRFLKYCPVCIFFCDDACVRGFLEAFCTFDFFPPTGPYITQA